MRTPAHLRPAAFRAWVLMVGLLTLSVGGCKRSAPEEFQYAYVTMSRADSVSILKLNSRTGALTHAGHVPVTPGVSAITLDKSGALAYLVNGDQKKVSAFRRSPQTGALTPLSSVGFPTGPSPSALVLHPADQFGYLFNEKSGTISAFAVHPEVGIRHELETSPFRTVPLSEPSHVSYAPGGTLAFVSSEKDRVIATFMIDFGSGTWVMPEHTKYPAMFSTKAAPISSIVDESGGVLYVATDQGVEAVQIEHQWGSLHSLDNSFCRPEGGPSLLALDKKGQFLFAGSPTGSLSVCAIDRAYKTLRWKNEVPVGSGGVRSIVTDAAGRFVYVTLKNSSLVYAYALDESGRLSPLAGSPFRAFPESAIQAPSSDKAVAEAFTSIALAPPTNARR